MLDEEVLEEGQGFRENEELDDDLLEPIEEVDDLSLGDEDPDKDR